MTYFTYNNIIDLFRYFVKNHYQLKRFGNGEISDIEEIISKEQTFPILWSNLVNIQYPSDNTKTLNFNILIFDLLESDKSNEVEIWSDTVQIAEDFIRFIKYNQTRNYELIGQPSIQLFTERFTDFVGGCNLNLTIQIDSNLQSDCGIPMDDFTFSMPSFIPIVPESNTSFNCDDLLNCGVFTSLSALTASNTSNIDNLNSVVNDLDTHISDVESTLNSLSSDVNDLSGATSEFVNLINIYTGDTNTSLNYLQSEIDSLSGSIVLFKSITQTIITGKNLETSIYSIPLPTDGLNYMLKVYSQAQISLFAVPGAAISHRLRIGTYSSPIDGATGANAIGNQTLIATNSASSGVQIPITRNLIFRGGTSGSIYGYFASFPERDDANTTGTFSSTATKDFTTQHYLYVTFNPSNIGAIVTHNQILVTLIKI